MSDPTDGIVWCTNDQPHKPHRRDNRWRDYDYCSGRPVPTAAEPTVQVPVSLLERLIGAAYRDDLASVAEARVLLSQLVPATEKQYISDLEPGTTFVWRVAAASTWNRAVRTNFGAVDERGNAVPLRFALDPSTIRDVQIPKEHP